MQGITAKSGAAQGAADRRKKLLRTPHKVREPRRLSQPQLQTRSVARIQHPSSVALGVLSLIICTLTATLVPGGTPVCRAPRSERTALWIWPMLPLATCRNAGTRPSPLTVLLALQFSWLPTQGVPKTRDNELSHRPGRRTLTGRSSKQENSSSTGAPSAPRTLRSVRQYECAGAAVCAWQWLQVLLQREGLQNN